MLNFEPIRAGLPHNLSSVGLNVVSTSGIDRRAGLGFHP